MKALIWFCCLFVATILNMVLGYMTGYKAGYGIFYLIVAYFAKKLCNKWDEHKEEKRWLSEVTANKSQSEQTEVTEISEETKKLFEVAKEKERLAMEARKEVAKHKAKTQKVVFVVVGLLLLCAFIVAFIAIPYSKLQSANKTFILGLYEDAYKQYDSLSSDALFVEQANLGKKNCKYRMADMAFFNKDYDKAISIYTELRDSAKVRYVRIVVADDTLRSGDYKQAAEMYEKLGEEQKAQDAWRSYGDLCISEKKYDEAIKIFENLKDYDRVLNSYCSWADDLMEQQRYQEAAEKYRLCNMETNAYESIYLHADHLLDTGKAADVPKQLQGYGGERIAQYVYDAVQVAAKSEQRSSIDEIAGEYGSYISDVNTQLAYCNLLRNAGVDLQMAYPNGVQVDADLSKFQLFAYMYIPAKERIADPDCSKMLVFSRTEEKPELLAHSESSEEEADNILTKLEEKETSSDSPYTVRLHPEMMEALEEGMRASTLEECTSIMLLEKGYYPRSGISIKSTNTYSYDGLQSGVLSDMATYRVYIEYAAYEGIQVYDVHNPLNMLCYDYYFDDALVHNHVLGNSDINLNLSSEEIDEIQFALENKDNAALALVLKKYPQDIIDFIDSSGWAYYMYIPEEDEQGNQIGQTFSLDDVDAWNIDKYMLGVHEDGWMEKQLKNKAVETMISYILSYK